MARIADNIMPLYTGIVGIVRFVKDGQMSQNEARPIIYVEMQHH